VSNALQFGVVTEHCRTSQKTAQWAVVFRTITSGRDSKRIERGLEYLIKLQNSEITMVNNL
jgi:hypothetical protein